MRLLLATLLIVWSAPSRAAGPVSIAADGSAARTGCGGSAASVAGSHNTVTLGGSCSGLMVRGDANVVSVELAPGGVIDIAGSNNRIRFTVAGGGAGPAVTIIGTATDISAEGARQGDAGGPLSLTGDSASITLDCTGQTVTIAGNQSRYELRGGCGSVVARGDGNRITLALRPGARVDVQGNRTLVETSVVGTGAAPSVSVKGIDSRVVAASPDGAVTASGSSRLARTVYDLDAKIVGTGTLVALPPTLFDGDGLHDVARPRLAEVADLAAQTHPAAVTVTVSDPSDPALAMRRAHAVVAALIGAGLPGASANAVEGAAGVTVLLLR